jgi:glycine cleavage system transcriptional repressor
MDEAVVLTVIGRDRVGIVDDISALILEFNCNIEESKMAKLGGEFAAIIMVSGESASLKKLTDSISNFQDRAVLFVTVKTTSEEKKDSRSIPYRLVTISPDTPGIVRSVTAILHKNSINIEEMETETVPAPWTGAPMFHMRAIIMLPPGIHSKELLRELESSTENQDLDITLTPFSFDQSNG